MTPTLTSLPDDQKRVLLAEAMLDAWLSAHSLVPTQNPPGTAGYKCNLSGMWIYTNANGRTLGMNYETPEKMREGAITDFKKQYPVLSDLNAAITLCDMLADKGWEPHIKKQGKTWYVAFTNGISMPSDAGSSLATAISHASLLALNLATK